MEEMATGFRFYPTEEELITFYLHNKLEDSNSNINRVIPVLDIYQLEPWHLPRYCGELCRGDTEQWFFFMPRQEKEARGGRPNRTTESGYWKATGSLSHVYSSDSKVIGVKKTMVFYKGKAPIGTKTKWKMNEYRAIKHDLSTSIPKLRDEVSLCRVYVVSGSLRAFDRRPTQVAETCSSSREVAVVNEENNKVITAVLGDGDAADQLQERSSSGSSLIMQGNQANVEDAGEMGIDSLANFMGCYEMQSP